MASSLQRLAPQEAFTLTTPYSHRQLQIAPVPAATIISLTATRSGLEGLRQRIGRLLEVDLPESGRFTQSEHATILATRPQTWLAVHEGLDFEWARRVANGVGDCAAVAGQSGAYGLLDLRGACVPALLARGTFLDLDPAQFTVGCMAASSLSHFPVILWRVPGPISFRVAVARSMARSMWEWLLHRADSLLHGAADSEQDVGVSRREGHDTTRRS
jgi:methylglutamate dehydrogenase subunit D